MVRFCKGYAKSYVFLQGFRFFEFAEYVCGAFDSFGGSMCFPKSRVGDDFTKGEKCHKETGDQVCFCNTKDFCNDGIHGKKRIHWNLVWLGLLTSFGIVG